jgi:hypothetical protein
MQARMIWGLSVGLRGPCDRPSRQVSGFSGMSMLAGAFLTRGAFARAFTGIGAHPSKSRFNCFGVAAFATDFMSGLLTAFFRAMSDTYVYVLPQCAARTASSAVTFQM